MFHISSDINDYLNKIQAREEYKPCPKVTERKAWTDIPDVVQQRVIEEAEAYIHYKQPMLQATAMMNFMRTGNREGYDKPAHEQRKALVSLVLGECVEDNGRFLDDIINLLWSLCEQTTWVLPAHYSLFGRKGVVGMLPDARDHAIDLFAGEVGILLAYTHYLLKDRLDKVTPVICQRIEYELQRRIIQPYLTRYDWWWMGYGKRNVNNWAPWCVSNCLSVVLLMEDNSYKRSEAVIKSMEIMQHFIDVYHPDGGCDEGTSYWDRAGASLFDCLEILHSSSNGQINYYDQPLIKAIGEYISKCHIADNYFVNFADGSAKVDVDAMLVYRYGKRVVSEDMIQLAAYAYDGHEVSPGEKGILRGLPYLFMYDELKGVKDKALPFKKSQKDFLLPDIQVATLREKVEAATGLFLAIKGGHNDESHNHNDIGQFVLYADGKPVIIDVGCGTYTKKTFSPRRYEIWTMQSCYHNLPEIMGIQQQYGAEFKGDNFVYEQVDKNSSVKLSIEKAYPEEAPICFWQRQGIMDRDEGKVLLQDTFKFKESVTSLENIMMTCCKPELDKNVIKLSYDKGKSIYLNYDSELLDVSCEVLHLEDKKLTSCWGSEIYRIHFKWRYPVIEGEMNFVFRS